MDLTQQKSMNDLVWKAAADNDVIALKKLLSFSPLAPAAKGSTFRRACYEGRLDVVEIMFDLGVDINEGNDLAFDNAVRKGHLDIVKFLVNHGVHITGYKYIHLAHVNKHHEIVTYLIETASCIPSVSQKRKVETTTADSASASASGPPIVAVLSINGLTKNAYNETGSTSADFRQLLGLHYINEDTPDLKREIALFFEYLFFNPDCIDDYFDRFPVLPGPSLLMHHGVDVPFLRKIAEADICKWTPISKRCLARLSMKPDSKPFTCLSFSY